MTAANAVLTLMWVGITAYALFGGADFGAGFWDLLAGGPARGARQRSLIEHTIGPVWEANHVWLIFALVILWTGFPSAFAQVMSTLYVPLTLAAIGIILRGSGFAFRKAAVTVETQRIFGAVFALSSVLTPFFLGAVAGAVASGRVPAGNTPGDPVASWWNPTSVLGGTLAVATCAYLAAVYLTVEARRRGEHELVQAFRTRALASGLAAGAIALIGIAVLHADARQLFEGLAGRAAPLIILSGAGGVATLVLVVRRSYVWARLAAALAVTAVVWGWGVGQYPYLLEGTVSIKQASGAPATLRAMLVSLAVGAVLLVPSLAALLVLAGRGDLELGDQPVSGRDESLPAGPDPDDVAGERRSGT
jgi:cytochrome d ubiquinol oxidase subunit II